MSNANLNLYDLGVLQLIKQNKTEDVSEFLELSIVGTMILERFEVDNYVEYIKPKKKGDSVYKCVRTTKKANSLLESISTASVAEEDKTVFDWLKKHYLKMGKEVGNGAKTQRHIRDFRIKTGIEKNNLLNLCLAFLQDEDNMTYNNILEYAFYKAPTAFETKFNIEESRLYKYYLKREPYFKSIFKDYESI